MEGGAGGERVFVMERWRDGEELGGLFIVYCAFGVCSLVFVSTPSLVETVILVNGGEGKGERRIGGEEKQQGTNYFRALFVLSGGLFDLLIYNMLLVWMVS